MIASALADRYFPDGRPLGFARGRDIVLGLSVWSALDAKSAAGRRWRTRLWTHSASVAAASKLLAERARLDGGAAFTAGLLHDVGKHVLSIRLGDSYWAMLDEAEERGENASASSARRSSVITAWSPAGCSWCGSCRRRSSTPSRITTTRSSRISASTSRC